MKEQKSQTTSTVSVRLDDNVKRVLEALAHAEHRNVSSFLGRLIAEHIATYETKALWNALRSYDGWLQTCSEANDPMQTIMQELEKKTKGRK
jgi:Ribbon-helix-helix protein, copG family